MFKIFRKPKSWNNGIVLVGKAPAITLSLVWGQLLFSALGRGLGTAEAQERLQHSLERFVLEKFGNGRGDHKREQCGGGRKSVKSCKLKKNIFSNTIFS